jgi:hypothetical protein
MLKDPDHCHESTPFRIQFSSHSERNRLAVNGGARVVHGFLAVDQEADAILYEVCSVLHAGSPSLIGPP